MFENESDKVRQDITILQRMLDFDEFEANGGDLFKIEWALNTALEHIEFLKSNLPYDHMNDDIEDEVTSMQLSESRSNRPLLTRKLLRLAYYDMSLTRTSSEAYDKNIIVSKKAGIRNDRFLLPADSIRTY